MKGSVRIAKISGIDIFVHWTFGLLLAYILYVNFQSGQGGRELFWSLAFILTIFFIIVLHELGHALTARRFGIKTRGITLLPIGGLAQLERMPDKPKEELLVALAGPLVNIVLAGILFLFVSMPETQEEAMQRLSTVNADSFLFQLFYVNVALALFNMIPAFPMDGGRVLRAILAMRLDHLMATLIAARIGQLLAVLFIVAGVFYNPFLIFIGLFVIFGAQAEAEQSKAASLLRGATVGEVAMDNYEVIQQEEPISAAVNKLLHGQDRDFVVLSGTELVGTLNRDEIIHALSSGGSTLPIKNAMNTNILRFSPYESLETAWKTMTAGEQSIAFVYKDERLMGIVDTQNIQEYIMVKSALKMSEGRYHAGPKIDHSPSMS